MVCIWWRRLAPLIPLPCRVTLTRYGPKKLDGDNLQSAFKAVRDTVAALIVPGLKPGMADELMSWEYDQVSGQKYGIKIEVSYDTDGAPVPIDADQPPALASLAPHDGQIGLGVPFPSMLSALPFLALEQLLQSLDRGQKLIVP